MSRQLAQTFFPSFINQAQQGALGRWVWEILFPIEVADLCPEATLQLGGTVIRLPYLGVSAILGIAIGAHGMNAFGSIIVQKRNDTKRKNCYIYLAVAFAAFGAMNVCGIFIHCLWEAPDVSYPSSTPVLWALDCFFTGVSAFSVAFASMEYVLPSDFSSLVFRSFVALQCLGIIFLGHFLIMDEATIFLEMWYLVPVIPAGHIVLYDIVHESGEIRSNQTKSNELHAVQQDWHVGIFLLGGILALGSIIADAPVCKILGTSTVLQDLSTAGTGMFLGCDVAFAGLMILWNNRKRRSESALTKKAK